MILTKNKNNEYLRIMIKKNTKEKVQIDFKA